MEYYKEKYEQALKKARTLHKLACETSHKNTRMAIEELFPELKESEDEGIRKWLIKAMKHLSEESTFFLEVPKDKVIAWLEKQGEQKPAFCHHEVDFSGCSEEYRKAYYDGWNNCNQQHDQLEAEQKPADKIEPKFKVGDIIRHKDSLAEYVIESISGGYYHGKGWGLSIDCDEDYELVGQKPAWSEEDEEMFDAIIADIQFTQKAHNHEVNQAVYEREIDWFKSLKDRMQTHPKQEWSEKDEKLYTWCASAIQTRYNDGLFTMDEYRETSLWLKSLKERMKGE